MTPPAGRLPPHHPVRAALAGWLAAGYVAEDMPLIVACSGGADSLALAAAALSSDREVSAVIVDHALQPGSAAVAERAAGQLRRLGYERPDIVPVQVTGPGGREAAARGARYRALSGKASLQGAAVLLAHTADDQAETVLLGLGRGSGPRSIAGMAPWRSPWGRPLLSVRRRDTEDACAALGVEPWQDPHNADPSFTRVRLRREAIPLLDEILGGGVVPALARTAELMAEDLLALDELAADAFVATVSDGAVDCSLLAGYPTALRRRVLRTWAGGALEYQHLARLDTLVISGRSGQSVRLPGAVDAVRRGKMLTLSTPAEP